MNVKEINKQCSLINLKLLSIIAFVILASSFENVEATDLNISVGQCQNITGLNITTNSTFDYNVCVSQYTCSNISTYMSYDERLMYLNNISELKTSFLINLSETKNLNTKLQQQIDDLQPLTNDFRNKYGESQAQFSALNTQYGSCNAEKATCNAQLEVIKKNPVVIDDKSCMSIGYIQDGFWKNPFATFLVTVGAILIAVRWNWINPDVFRKRKEEEDTGDSDEGLSVNLPK